MEIALLEDDLHQAEVMKLWIESAKHTCQIFATGGAFIEGMQRKRYDLLIIDWMLPDTDGIKVLTWVREHLGWQVPVLFATARNSESDIVNALKYGADDFMTKPIKHLEMLARIEALGRRAAALRGKEHRTAGCYEIDMEAHRISRSGEKIELTQKEFELAIHMFQNPGRLLSRDSLLEAIWGLNAEVDTRTVDTHVSRLRKKLQLSEENGWRLIPVYGYGYRLEVVDGKPEQVT